jgi:hypothetical protein
MALFAAFVWIGPGGPSPSYRVERIALYVTAAADVLTTRMAIRNGAYEGNPLLTRIVGKTPSTLKLVAVKAAGIGLVELSAHVLKKRGEHGQARAAYWIMAITNGLVSGFNLQWAWK